MLVTPSPTTLIQIFIETKETKEKETTILVVYSTQKYTII